LIIYLINRTNAARKKPELTPELLAYLKNLKTKLGNNSKIKNALNQLYVNPANLPNANTIRKAMRDRLGSMRLSNLLEARKVLKGREVDEYLLAKVRDELEKIRRLDSQERAWRLNELYKSLPSDFEKGRRLVERAIIEEMRRAANRDPNEARRRFRYLASNINLNKFPSSVRKEFRALTESSRRNDDRRRRRENNYYGRRGRENNYYRRRGGEYGISENRGGHPPSRNGGPLNETRGPVFGRQGAANQTGAPPNTNALPSNQKNAIQNAGGVNSALRTIAQVPGGAPEVAKAAADLNEMNGNVQKVIAIRGTRPAAIAAVRRLGGPRATSYALEGLNTLSQTAKTQKRKAETKAPRKKKPKKSPVRIAELTRVINAVKKTRLVGLVARNVTKAPRNPDHLKPYYKRVIKANILRRPFAKIVRKAAKAKKN
jgi:hypothetical protein